MRTTFQGDDAIDDSLTGGLIPTSGMLGRDPVTGNHTLMFVGGTGEDVVKAVEAFFQDSVPTPPSSSTQVPVFPPRVHSCTMGRAQGMIGNPVTLIQWTYSSAMLRMFIGIIVLVGIYLWRIYG